MTGEVSLGEVSLDVAYGPLPAHRVDIHRPSKAAPGSAGATLLMFHGGGWRTGDKAGFAETAAKFAQAGILAISAEYRLSEGDADSRWPAQLQDAQAALSWLHANAQQLGADPARICVMGASAGGQLALFTGLPYSTGSDAPPLPACVISLSGPTDLSSMMTVRARMIKNLVGGSNRAQVLAAAHAASPVSHVRPGGAPVLLIHGKEDPVVPFAGAEAYHAALVEAGVPAWFISHPGAHLLKGASRQVRATVQQAQIDFALHHRLDRPPGRLDLS